MIPTSPQSWRKSGRAQRRHLAMVGRTQRCPKRISPHVAGHGGRGRVFDPNVALEPIVTF